MSSPIDCTHSPLSGSSGDSPPSSACHSTPIAASTSNPRLVHVNTSSSTPNSPQIPRQSSGRIKHGMRKMLMLPRRPTSSSMAHSLTPKAPRPRSMNTSAEEPLEAAEHTSRPKLIGRMIRNVPGTRRIRTPFRRKRRADSKQYHSDDGYTSDPGILREASGQEEEEEEDETDGDADSSVVRHTHKVRELEQKLEMARQLLQEEEESDQGTEATVGSLKTRSWLNPRSKSSLEQQRKKVEKLESQLRELRERGPLETHWNPLKGSFSQLRDLMSLRKKRLHPGLPPGVEEEEENDDDDDMFPEGVLPPVGSNEDLSVDVGEAETFAVDPELSLSTVKQSLVALRESGEEFMADHGKLREELEEMRAHITHQTQVVQGLYDKLEQEKDRAERLEVQVNDITELHQNQVEELRTQLAQMESLTMGKSQDLEDAMEECTSKVDRLDAFVHQLIDSGNQKGNSVVRKPLARALSFLLVILVFILATAQKIPVILRNKLGLATTLLVLVPAVLLYFVWR